MHRRLFAHYVPIAATDPEGVVRLAIVDRDAQGLAVDDNRSGFGQRTTASGKCR